MKCVFFYNPENRIERISDEAAEKAVKAGKAMYIPRREWKAKVRDAAREAGQ